MGSVRSELRFAELVLAVTAGLEHHGARLHLVDVHQRSVTLSAVIFWIIAATTFDWHGALFFENRAAGVLELVVADRFRENLAVAQTQPRVSIAEMTGAGERAGALARRARFDRNWAWFQAHASEIYAQHRGKCVCVAGEELFIAQTPAAVLEMATSAHPEDDGRFTRIIPHEKIDRVYAHSRRMARLR